MALLFPIVVSQICGNNLHLSININSLIAEFAVYHTELKAKAKKEEVSSQNSMIQTTKENCGKLEGDISHLNSQIDTLNSQFNEQIDVSER